MATIEAHRRRFRVTWYVGGVRHRRSVPSLAEAKEFVETLAEDAERGGRRVKGNVTVGEVVDNWYRGHRRNLSSGTQRDYEGRIRRDVSRIGAMRAIEVARNPRILRELYLSLTPTTARRLHAILHQAFADALHHGEVPRNPCAVAKPRRPRAAERLIPAPAEVEAIIAAASEQHPSWGLFVDISATLGTRRGETCALSWEDLDFEGQRVHIRRAVCKGTSGPTELKPPKTGRERTVMIGPAFFEQLRAVRGIGWIFTGGRNVPAARPWHPDWPGHRFQRLMQDLGLPYTLHSLRHFVATQLLARGMPVTQVAQFLGHKDPSVTMDLYANHVVDDVQRMMGEAAASLYRRRSPLSVVRG